MLGRIMFVVAALTGAALGQGETAITYQGELREGGSPAQGSFKMDFSLWDAATGGSQVGATINLDGVGVSDGAFTVELDFGVQDTSVAWLEVTVEGSTLDPRTRITASPYSLQTRGIFVDETGNVGLGTTVPTERLQLDGRVLSSGANTGFVATNPNEPQASVRLNWPNDVARIRVGGNGAGAQSGLDIQTTGSRSMLRITHDGRVGIGTTTPAGALHALSDETAGSVIRGVNVRGLGVGVWGDAAIGIHGRGSSIGAEGYGHTGVQGHGEGFDFNATGPGVNYGATSSRRWKHDVRRIEDSIEKLARLRGVRFTWDSDHGGQRDVGMIAEDVGAVLPEIVRYEHNGIDAIGMDYSKLTPLLVEAVNALREEKDADIAAQAARIERLEARLAALEAFVTGPTVATTEGAHR